MNALQQLKQKKIEIDKEIKDIQLQIDSFPYWSLSYQHERTVKGKGFQTTSDLREIERLNKELIPLEAQSQAYADGISACEEVLKEVGEDIKNKINQSFDSYGGYGDAFGTNSFDKDIDEIIKDKLKGETK